ncbi:MAG: acetamidase/formamidase family protein [Acidisphaera sp.]|nr:acetamidase/formamidase family protein [Acidisphaera sp.]MBV9813695.1 acetamidase/formamidase family protein [Acetobacteraceae bacterium]
MPAHTLAATPETIRWGLFSADFPPVLTVDSGDSVTVECVSGGPDVMPPPGSGLKVPEALTAIHRSDMPRAPGHLITGPIGVRGARPGDMLQVDIERIEPGADWGFCGFRPLAGALPTDFSERYLSHFPVDRARRVCRLPYGVELALAPFFGVMGVAPRPSYGAISTVQPRDHGGNLDNKELGEGSTLFLPVWADGALFSVGDGHGVQGDGEVCINALEMCLTGTFRFTLHKAPDGAPLLRYPRAETRTHFISMGMHDDLDEAMRTALREMIAFICARSNLSREQAYQFCSLAVDFRVTQVVNGEKGVHGMLRKKLLF